MTSDSSLPLPTPNDSETISEEKTNWQVRLKTEEGILQVVLPTEAETPGGMSWTDFWEQLKHRLNGNDRFFSPQMSVHLMAQDRLLDTRQLQAIADALTEAKLQLKRVYTNRRQTAVAAATAGHSVEQQAAFSSLVAPLANKPVQALSEPLYLQMTVRSGVEIRHPGTVVILGDVNPGGIVVAVGDIFVWWRLRGIAHAGAEGNTECRIMALQMEPTQLRIADQMARAPENPPPEFYPEVAHVTPEGIRLTKAADFSRINLGKIQDKG